MTTARKIKWLIAHHPQYLFIRTAKYFSQELEKLLPGQFEIEILSMTKYIEKYDDIEEMKLVSPEIPGLEDNFCPQRFTRAETWQDVNQKWVAIFRAIEDGKIEMSQTQVTVIGSIMDNDFSALDMPFLFKDHNHATKVLDGEIGDEMLNNLADRSNMRGLAFTYSGGYRVIGAKTEIKSINDLHGKFLLSASLPSNQLFTDLGTNTINKPYSTPQDYADLAVNDGAVETTYLRFSGDYVLKTEHSMFLTSILTGDGFWNTLTQEQQNAFRTAAKKCATHERQMSIKDSEVYEYYAEANGITINRISEEELNMMKEKSKKVYSRLQDRFSSNLVSRILEAGHTDQ